MDLMDETSDDSKETLMKYIVFSLGIDTYIVVTGFSSV